MLKLSWNGETYRQWNAKYLSKSPLKLTGSATWIKEVVVGMGYIRGKGLKWEEMDWFLNKSELQNKRNKVMTNRNKNKTTQNRKYDW